jgi:hypothetical protein
MKKQKLNKAVTDSLASVVQNGIDVNIRLETITYVKLIFLALLVAGLVLGYKYAMFKLKIK